MSITRKAWSGLGVVVVSVRRNGEAAKSRDAKAQAKIDLWKEREKEWTR